MKSHIVDIEYLQGIYSSIFVGEGIFELFAHACIFF